MKELSKELTAELLELVLDDKLDGRNITDNIQLCGNTVHYMIKDSYMANINTDTLTRLMIEYIGGHYVFNIFNSSSVMGYVVIIENKKFIANSIFEAVLKATHWVATEKGLL